MGLCCSTAELLNLSVSVQMEPVLMYFRSLRIQPAQLMAMVFFHPRLLSYSVAEDLEPVVSKLSDAGIDREQLPLLLEKVPQVLEDGPVCLRELQEVLEGKVGIGWWEAGTVLLEVLPKARRPREVAQVVEFLASLQVDEDDVRMLGRFHPWVLAMSMEDLKARADHFYGYGLNSEDIGRLFASAPNALLGSTLPDLQPRLTLLEKLARLGGWQSAGHLLLTYPQLVEASVSKIQTLQRILGSRGIDGPQLVQALAAQTHPTKWAGDLFAMQLNGTVAPGSGR
mmetsp:Transcript_18137/g.50770  ORF Transcript_18137/g.50770 Transcript_18137/m.50770 type:complete len:283 (+) Transcript_18137:1163-2011(+)